MMEDGNEAQQYAGEVVVLCCTGMDRVVKEDSLFVIEQRAGSQRRRAEAGKW